MCIKTLTMKREPRFELRVGMCALRCDGMVVEGGCYPV